VEVSVPAFAKINWFLEIQGKRPDSYHELNTLLQTIDLRDDLSFTLLNSGDLQLEVSGFCTGPVEENLVWKAARLLQAGGPKKGAYIRLRKRIPSGAGLGGGSSDAAITLLVLNRLWNRHLPLSELDQLASSLGSDVPFFLRGGTAVGWGRGERIQALDDPFDGVPLLICYPGFSLSTSEVYRNSGFPLLGEPGAELTTSQVEPKIRFFHKALVDKTWALLHNDLEKPVLSRYPALREMKQLLEDKGCTRVILSGSGSSLLALGTAASLEKAAREWADLKKGTCFLCQTLSRSRYWATLHQSTGVNLRAS